MKDGKTVIVTGGNKGIGAAISRVFCDNGYNVMIGARSSAGAANTARNKMRFLKTDVRNEKDHIDLAKAAKSWTGRIDAYINCAGYSAWSKITDVSENFLDSMLDTNLKGLFWGCKAAAKNLKRGGCIINISSIAGKRGSSNNSVYCASKFGVNGITQALAKELGPRGIRVNAVCPVYVNTEGVVRALGEPSSPAKGRDVKKYLEKFAAENTALKRLPTADEIARVCLFLASEGASAITGQCINVDCGVLPQ